MIAKIDPLLRNFLRAESVGGIVLMLATAVALFASSLPDVGNMPRC
jgi:Na+/H+ antiporter NhaA